MTEAAAFADRGLTVRKLVGAKSRTPPLHLVDGRMALCRAQPHGKGTRSGWSDPLDEAPTCTVCVGRLALKQQQEERRDREWQDFQQRLGNRTSGEEAAIRAAFVAGWQRRGSSA
jgi:hypothetical protein